MVAFIPTTLGTIGSYLIVGRQFWTMARDNAAPYSKTFAQISNKWSKPFNAMLVGSVMIKVMGFIYLGSARAFNDLAGSFVILSSISYLAAILPHLLSGRNNTKPGAFWMRGVLGYLVNGVACLYLSTFVVIFSFPGILPVTASNMNYSSLISGGLTMLAGGLWFWREKDYKGPGYIPWPHAETGERDAEVSISGHFPNLSQTDGKVH